MRIFLSERERGIFESKKQTEFTGLVVDHAEIDPIELTAPLGAFAMAPAGHIDARRYLDLSREWFRKRYCYQSADLDVDADLMLAEDGVRIPKLDVWANRVIFCQGFLNKPNPYFASVPFQAAQGEILTLHIPDFDETSVIHCGIWLAPAEGDLYYCGSTYSWEPFDGQPSAAGRAELERKLQSFLKLPYEVVDHRAAVRPIIRESRPRIGMHPQHPRLGFFNGLGSKGSLLAPIFARKFVEHIYEGAPLDPDTDVQKFLE